MRSTHIRRERFGARSMPSAILKTASPRDPTPEGVVLRYGGFYGVDTGLFDPLFIDQIAKRHVPVIGTGDGWWLFIHIEDAAHATALAVERGRPSSIYNIVDDAPAPVREWLPFLADLVGARPPRHLP